MKPKIPKDGIVHYSQLPNFYINKNCRGPQLPKLWYKDNLDVITWSDQGMKDINDRPTVLQVRTQNGHCLAMCIEKKLFLDGAALKDSQSHVDHMICNKLINFFVDKEHKLKNYI